MTKPACFAAALAILCSACAPSGQAPGQTPASTPAPTRFPAKFFGLGTEPFWNIAVDGTTLTWTSADAPGERRIAVTRREEAGRLHLAGTLDGKALSATAWPETCSDGMSDRSYPYTLTVMLDGRKRMGCADR
jgi:uncharacterized membrane protein